MTGPIGRETVCSDRVLRLCREETILQESGDRLGKIGSKIRAPRARQGQCRRRTRLQVPAGVPKTSREGANPRHCGSEIHLFCDGRLFFEREIKCHLQVSHQLGKKPHRWDPYGGVSYTTPSHILNLSPTTNQPSQPPANHSQTSRPHPNGWLQTVANLAEHQPTTAVLAPDLLPTMVGGVRQCSPGHIQLCVTVEGLYIGSICEKTRSQTVYPDCQ
ncbi:hypothetical protein Bbelb_137910 [Branchiostoma belcheri]|nr:hypothetical protein Bbelb_137910 [Branchiostoma belcheri]